MSWQLSPITEEPVSEAQDDPALVAAQNYEKNVVTYITIPITAILLEHASPQPGEHVVDVACGTGVVARQTAPRVGAAGTVVGVDINAGGTTNPITLTMDADKAATATFVAYRVYVPMVAKQLP